jgi:hypothetical protein
MRIISMAVFASAALFAAGSASAQVATELAQKLDAGAEVCEAGLAGSALRAAPVARDAGFTFDGGRQIWSWTGGGAMVAIQFNDEGCDVLVVGQAGHADAVADRVASRAHKHGYTVTRIADPAASQSRIEGTSSDMSLAFREVGGGILRLEFRPRF